jgi:predicted kinase
VKLLLLNGPPGSGKSTLARHYADDHPPALALDVDRIRAMLGGRRTSPGEAGLLARDIASAEARTNLAAGMLTWCRSRSLPGHR